MNVTQKSFLLARLGVRNLATSRIMMQECKPAQQNVPRGYKKLKSKMEKYQINDGVPIHLKGGAFDRICYISTLVLCGIGLGMSVQLIYQLSMPKSE